MADRAAAARAAPRAALSVCPAAFDNYFNIEPLHKNLSKEEEEQLDGWEEEYDRIYEACADLDYEVEYLCLHEDEEIKEKCKEHYRSVRESRGFEIPIAAPEGYEDLFICAASLEDAKEKKLMVEGAQLALALYNARKKKDLKFKEVISANYLPFTSSREIFLTFKVEDEHTSSPIAYQARLRTKDYDWREKVTEKSPSKSIQIKKAHAFGSTPLSGFISS